ncbi:hypothetical protein CYY_004001 [Polysphondylium violaceum]|uniref:Uncharacterized protein n=1 Tax=Polysphondylium violaceum TaxID=133409 RepID=A0A8J4V5L0_9MYCE|nr:hypothetical protein CYY_004001 [Polysphondylium violaceum]
MFNNIHSIVGNTVEVNYLTCIPALPQFNKREARKHKVVEIKNYSAFDKLQKKYSSQKKENSGVDVNDATIVHGNEINLNQFFHLIQHQQHNSSSDVIIQNHQETDHETTTDDEENDSETDDESVEQDNDNASESDESDQEPELSNLQISQNNNNNNNNNNTSFYSRIVSLVNMNNNSMNNNHHNKNNASNNNNKNDDDDDDDNGLIEEYCKYQESGSGNVGLLPPNNKKK